MATDYKTPGVYVEEISKFPPSVAQVETAIPAFVGYTSIAVIDRIDYHAEKIYKPIKISSLLEYEFFFGGPPKPTSIEIDFKSDNTVNKVAVNSKNLLYDSLRMFYANGGGDCYIVSVGKHRGKSDNVSKDDLKKGLDSIKKVDEPTLLIIPEAVNLDAAQAGEIHVAMLTQCKDLQDRFAILDIVDGATEPTPTNDPILTFRSNAGMNFLNYGAAYYPWLKTTLSFSVDYDTVKSGTYKKEGSPIADIEILLNNKLVSDVKIIDLDIAQKSTFTTPVPGDITDHSGLKTFGEAIFDYALKFLKLTINDSDVENKYSAKSIHTKFTKENSDLHNLLQLLFDYNHFSQKSQNPHLSDDWNNHLIEKDFAAEFSLLFKTPGTDNNIFSDPDPVGNGTPYFLALNKKLEKLVSDFYSELKSSRAKRTEQFMSLDTVYQNIVNAINSKGIVLPPGSAIAGVYAMVDRERGVWKAPANVSLTAVKGPAINITHEDQENLNVDTVAGKSVNAIRAFTGKGTLVWGSRTLAGNDNEWRYIPVRRFFIMVEESVKKATEQFVFEPNDANTWVKIRAMIENFLFLQWRAGALAGAKQEHAFYVRIGLGQTMTAQDILEGRMNVEIGMAAVRPAEFIILKFSHKMQES